MGLVLLQFRDGFVGEGMPVAHGHYDAGIEGGSEFPFEGGGLLEGEIEDGGTAADFRIVVADMTGARLGDQASERAPGNGSEGEVDDIRVAEEVVEKGFDGVDGIGASELE